MMEILPPSIPIFALTTGECAFTIRPLLIVISQFSILPRFGMMSFFYFHVFSLTNMNGQMNDPVNPRMKYLR